MMIDIPALIEAHRADLRELGEFNVDHAPRHDAHDQEHAKFALQHIRAAISELRR